MLTSFARRSRSGLPSGMNGSSSRSLTTAVRNLSALLKPVTENEGSDEYSAEILPTEGEWAGCSRRFMAPIKIAARGAEILTDPLYNKGTAFKNGERDRLRFRGLLPPRVMNMETQKERFLRTLRSEESTIRKNTLLEDLHGA